MGTVWRARRSDGVVKRSVALKLPHLGPFNAQLAERFILERDILAELAHPNIARLYDAGVSDQGQPFLALEYIDGVSIHEYCDKNRLTVRRRLILFGQVLEAVQYAHARLVIHRDIKPSNILVTSEGTVHLLDFGIAKILADGQTGDSPQTEFGARALTPDYASPEQITGQPLTITSDIYSLGVVLYELLAGRRPYRLKRNSRLALEDAIATANIIAPSRACSDADEYAKRSTNARQHLRELRGDLDSIVSRAVCKEADKRYPSVDAFSQDVANYLSGHPVSARPESAWYRTKKFIGRNSLPAAFSVGLVAALLIGSVVALRQARIANKQRDRAFVLAERNEAINAFLHTVITDVTRTGAPISTKQMLERSEALARKEFAHNPEQLATMFAMLADTHRSGQDWEESERLLLQALDMTRLSSDTSLRASILCAHGLIQSKRVGIEAAIASFDAALSIPDIDPITESGCLQYRSYIAKDVNDGRAALEYMQRALAAAHRAPVFPPEREASLMAEIASAYYVQGETDQANRYFAAVMAKVRKFGLDRNPDALLIRNNWALVMISTGNPLQALQQYDEVIKIASDDDPTAEVPPIISGNRAFALESIGRYPEALAENEHGLKVAKTLDSKQWIAYCLVGLAEVSRRMGDLNAAENYLTQIDKLTGVGVPDGSSVWRRWKTTQGLVALARGRIEDSETIFATEVAGTTKNGGAPHLWLGLAELDFAKGDLPSALSHAEQALKLAQSQQGKSPYSNRVGLAYLLLGEGLEKQGKADEARRALQSALLHLSNTVDPHHPALAQTRQLLQSITVQSK